MTQDVFPTGVTSVALAATTQIDAFGRLRVSQPETLFDSKQLVDKQPLFWDDQEVSGGSTTSTYSQNAARTRIGVALNTAGKRVRQTFMRFNYQPGKSTLVLMTTVMSDGGSGITAGVGAYDDDNGVFFKSSGGVLSFVTRSNATGTPVDTPVAQSAWNGDKLDGSGESGITIDPTKTQIIWFDMEWLGVGTIRAGFVIDQQFIVVHTSHHANTLDVVYMSTPNLPLRYSIENDGTGAATTMDHICTTVISEGGVTDLGLLRHVDSNSVSSLSAGVAYAMIGIKLKSSALGTNVKIVSASSIATSQNDQVHWSLKFNPTVAGTFTYSDLTNSSVQTALGAVTNTVTGGISFDGGYFSTAQPSSAEIKNALRIGAAIDNTVDEIVLCARPITNNITVEQSLTWRELS